MRSTAGLGRLPLVATLTVFLMIVSTVVVQGQTPTPPPGTKPTESWRARYKPPAHIRIGSQLYHLALAQQEGKFASVARTVGARLDGDRVFVTIQARPGQAGAASAAVVAAGGQSTAVFGDYVDAYVPVAALISLAQHPSVGGVDFPPRAVPAQGVDGEGVALINAPAWHGADLTGAGVRIGIIDLGFEGYRGLLGNELPAAVDDTCTQVPLENGQRHGTAVAEIVHEVAPRAQLFLANFVNSGQSERQHCSGRGEGDA